MDNNTFEKFVFCLESIPDSENPKKTQTVESLEQLALTGINSIYNYCDSIEELEARLGNLVYDDKHFSEYEIIYLVMEGKKSDIQLNGYCYSLQEIAELFEGKLTGKIVHFANTKKLDLTSEEAQYFLDVSGARAISGYGTKSATLNSWFLDRLFFSIYQQEFDLKEALKLLFQKNSPACTALDFRLYS